MQNDYYYYDKNGYRFIVLNPNYYQADAKDINYSLGNYYSTTGSVGYLPKTQLNWLEKSILEFDGSCIIFSHQSIERVDGIANHDEVKTILENCNSVRQNAVILCVNGHYHHDYIKKINDIIYLDLNSCSFEYIAKKHHYFPYRLKRKFKGMSNTLIYNEPIHAVITIIDDGEMIIDGIKSSFYKGITVSMTKNPILDTAGRATTPDVCSYHCNYKIKSVII